MSQENIRNAVEPNMDDFLEPAQPKVEAGAKPKNPFDGWLEVAADTPKPKSGDDELPGFMEPAQQGQQQHTSTEAGVRDARFNDWINGTAGPTPVTPTAAQEHPGYGKFDAGIEMNRQVGIAAADRGNREAAGLDPRVHNLT